MQKSLSYEISHVVFKLLNTGILKIGPFLLMVLTSWRREERDGKTRGIGWGVDEDVMQMALKDKYEHKLDT